MEKGLLLVPDFTLFGLMQHAASDNRERCYIIAAVDLAHNGELSTAKKLIDVAVESGCDAVKFQRRSVEHLGDCDLGYRQARGAGANRGRSR